MADQNVVAPLKQALDVLQKISRWHDEFPATGMTWADGSPISFRTAFGSDGERDYMRNLAADAIAALSAAQAQEAQSKDKNVEDLREMLRSRSAVGLQKYGVTTDKAGLPLARWLQHALEETLDNAVYLRQAKRLLDAAPLSAAPVAQISDEDIAHELRIRGLRTRTGLTDSGPELRKETVKIIAAFRYLFNKAQP